MKIRFNRKRLIGALKISKQDALAQHRKDLSDYHAKIVKEKAKYIVNVEKFLVELRASKDGEMPERYDLGGRFAKGTDIPSKPKQPTFAYVDTLIQQLELSDDEVVVCDTKEDYVQLTRACAILGTCKVK